MSDYDADLALAISRSLRDQKPPATSRSDAILVIDSSDDEGAAASSKKLPVSQAANPRSAPKSLAPTRGAATSSSAKPVRPNVTIDLDTTLEAEDTATEDESDDDFFILAAKNNIKGKETTRTSSSVLAKVALSKPSTSVSASTSAKIDATPAPPLTPMSAFRAERAKMEQERIARLKRMRPDVGEKRNREDDGDDESDDMDSRPSKRPSPALTTSSSASASKSKATNETVFAGSFNIPDKAGSFWHGAVRQTANKHVVASLDTKPVFRLSEILPPPRPSPMTNPDNVLSFAMVSSYAVDLPWLYGLFSPDVPVVLVAQPGQDGRAEVHHALPGWVRASPALAGGRGCMHVKLMLLFYKSGRLRVVIPTANFVPYDWRDIENSVWLQDVPLRTGPAPPSSQSQANTDGFGERLEFVLKSLNVSPALEALIVDQRASGEVRLPLRNIDELHTRWNWSRVIAKLTPSIAGKHTGWPAVLKVGHVALMKSIRDMGATSDTVKIECQGSSIGSYSSAWTNEFMSSCRGISPDTWLDIPKARRSKAPHPNTMRIVFPSLSTVDASVLGRPGGGTMFCNRRQWDASTFPKELFVDSNSKRGKVLMHAKMILGLLDDEEPEEGKPKGWLYVGSHNFTPSAWGNLSGSGFSPIMNITNYELGVVVSLESAAQGDGLACWKRPARPYVKGRDEPWMQSERM